MAGLTNSGSNFAGTVVSDLYQVFKLGWELVSKGLVRVVPNVASDLSLPRLSASDSPIAANVDDPSTTDATSTVTYTERKLSVTQSMVLLNFNPDDFLDIWPDFRSVNDLTNLALNPGLISNVLESQSNAIGNQLGTLFFQGDTTSGTASLARMDGLLKKALADSDVVDVAGAVNLTSGNIIEKVGDVWDAIPDRFLEDASVRIMTSYPDYKLLQKANNDAKKANVGVLDENILNMFLQKRIIPVHGIPQHVMIATRASAAEDSNLVFGYWVNPNEENPLIAKFNPLGRDWGMRIDMAIGMNYRAGEDIVLYDGR